MRVYVIQLEHNDKDTKNERIKHTVALINDLDSPDLILLPELWGTGFFAYDKYFENSEDLYGETVASLSDIARAKCTYIFTGSFIEQRKNGFYNTALLLDRGGDIAAQYRKIHLFGDEKKLLSAGEEISVAETELGIIGLSICYDLRFPELYRKLSLKGTEIFLSCYALPKERLPHWQILTPARAVENQSFFISCGCAGINRGVTYSGHSMIVSPMGEIIREGSTSGDILCADIDINDAKLYRSAFPALNDRRMF